MSDDIWRWSATRIATAIRDRDISAREALESCLARMAAVNTKLNAVTVDLSKSAREAADRASSVAAGITPLAHGNDIAGSVRFPAYCCGLAGIRPSFGRVPAYNPTQTAERSLSSQLMSVQGTLARSVADVRLGLVAMAARDPRDPWWTPVPLEGPAPSSRQPIRVAVVTEALDLAGVN